MKRYEIISKLYRVSALRAVAIVLYCAVFCMVCYSCKSSRAVSQISTTERHEVFDNIAAADTLDLTGAIAESDTAAVNIKENSNDTIKIERDDAGRPVLIVWNHNANLLGTFGRSTFSDLDFTGFHTSGRSESAGTVDDFNKKEEESKTEIDAAIPLETLIGLPLLGLVILYILYVIIADGVWPKLKK